ncbi:MAG: hypothetical protein GWO24_34880, partial [Akkermansiaceae bacterium]|nr:hypothetical protein [Akkermansiaceae bacterium]
MQVPIAVRAAESAGFAQYFVMAGEGDLLAALTAINPSGTTPTQGPVSSRLSIVASANGVQV